MITALLLLPAVHVQAARSQEELRRFEVMMAVLVNVDRAEQDIPMLEYSFDVADVARAHSLDMAKHDFFGHKSPRTGGPADRIKRARLPALGSAENLVTRNEIVRGEQALMNSPPHRQNILNPEFTHVGIGIVENARGQLVITQNFILRIEEMDPETAPEAMLELINSKRQEQKVPPLILRESLVKSAVEHSEKMNEAGRIVTAAKVSMTQVDKRRYRAIQYAVVGAGKLEDVLKMKSCLDPRFREIGLGPVLNTHENKPPGLLWVTIILGCR